MSETVMTFDVLIEIPKGSRNKLTSIEEVNPHIIKEIEHFFSVYKDLEEKKVGIEGWEDKESAITSIIESRKRYWDDYNALGTSKV